MYWGKFLLWLSCFFNFVCVILWVMMRGLVSVSWVVISYAFSVVKILDIGRFKSTCMILLDRLFFCMLGRYLFGFVFSVFMNMLFFVIFLSVC